MPVTMLDPECLTSILVIATSHVGNNIFLTPAIRLLAKRVPRACIDVATFSRRGAAVFEGSPHVRRVHTVYLRYQLHQLAKRYDVVIGLHHTTSHRYLDGSGIRSWIIGPDTGARHRADTALEFIRDLIGCQVGDEDRCYTLNPSPHDVEAVDRLLRGVVPGDRLIGLHMGSGRTAVHGWKVWYRGRNRDPRLWCRGHYITLALLLIRRDPRIRFVLTGSRNERFLGRMFVRHVQGSIDLIGRTSVLQLAALMSRLRVFVTPDTGALHVAASTEIPIAMLCGPTDPACTGPYPLRSQHTLIRKAHTADITPEEVAKVVLMAREVP